jgi:hypothetical protein
MNYDAEKGYVERIHLDSGNCTLPENIDKLVIEKYKPLRYLIEKPKSLYHPNIIIPDNRMFQVMKMNKHKNLDYEQTRRHVLKTHMSMHYSHFKSNEIKEVYANENGFVYDYVIRIRFDIELSKPLYCSKLDADYLYFEDIGQGDELINELCVVGSNMIMNVYATLFFNFEYLNSFKYHKKDDRLENTLEPSEEASGLSEHMVRDLIHLFKIPTKKLNLGISW